MPVPCGRRDLASHLLHCSAVAELQQHRSLELEEDLEFEQVEWRTARITWFVLIALMAATLTGLFGGGPLSDASAADPSGGLRVEYPRFARYGASLRLVVHARPGPDGRLPVTFSPALVRAYRVQQITPAPARSHALGEAVEYIFEVEPGTPGAAMIFELQSTRRWLLSSEVRSGDRSVSLTQFIYP